MFGLGVYTQIYPNHSVVALCPPHLKKAYKTFKNTPYSQRFYSFKLFVFLTFDTFKTFEMLAAAEITVLFAVLSVCAHAQYCTCRSAHAHYWQDL